jgi:hypothetical protein
MLDLKNFSTWEEASRWLAKHGFGMTQIEQIKEEWVAATTPTSISKPVEDVKMPDTTKPATKPVSNKTTAPKIDTK